MPNENDFYEPAYWCAYLSICPRHAGKNRSKNFTNFRCQNFPVEEFQRFLLWAYNKVHMPSEIDATCCNSRIVFVLQIFIFISSDKFGMDIIFELHFQRWKWCAFGLKIPDDPLFEKGIRKTLLSSYGTINDRMKMNQIDSRREDEKHQCACEKCVCCDCVVYPDEIFSRIRKRNDNQIHIVDIKRPNECTWNGTHVSLCFMVKFMNEHCKRTHALQKMNHSSLGFFSVFFCRRFDFFLLVLQLSNKHDVIRFFFLHFYFFTGCATHTIQIYGYKSINELPFPT